MLSVHNAARAAAAGASGLVMLCHSESLWKEAADSVTRRISSSRSFCTALRLGVGLILAPGLQGLGESPRAPRRRAACRCEHDAPSRWRLRLGVGSVPSSGAGEQCHSGDFKLVPAVGTLQRGQSTRSVLRLVLVVAPDAPRRRAVRCELSTASSRAFSIHTMSSPLIFTLSWLPLSVTNRRFHHTIAMTTSSKYTPGRARPLALPSSCRQGCR